MDRSTQVRMTIATVIMQQAVESSSSSRVPYTTIVPVSSVIDLTTVLNY